MAHSIGRRGFMTLLGAAVLAPSASDAQPSSRERALVDRILRMQADLGAILSRQFIDGIQGQMKWTVQLPWSTRTLDQRRFDGLRLLRVVPALAEIVQLDAAGIEQLRVSRSNMDNLLPKTDYSQAPKFTVALGKKVYYGPAYFHESGPLMTLSVGGDRRDAGVSVGEIDLKMLTEIATKMKVGDHGVAYIVDTAGLLIAHSDISLTEFRKTDMTSLAHVQAARSAGASATASPVQTAKDINGREVVATYVTVPDLGWLVFVELPTDEIDRLGQ